MYHWVSKLETTAQNHHYHPKPLGGLIGVLASKAYLAGYLISQWLRKRKQQQVPHYSAPIISVGNLTTGGTGKTPMVISLAQYFEKQGLKCLILCRPYRAPEPHFGAVSSPLQSDEAYLIQQQLQHSVVMVGKNRTELLDLGIKQTQPDVVILDDGFQTRQIPRLIDIVLVDGQRGFGNQHLLPAGPLRTPKYQLAKADMVVITKTLTEAVKQQVEKALSNSPFQTPIMVAPFNYAIHWQHTEKQDLKPSQAVIISAIANPSSLTLAIEKMGIEVLAHHTYPDHHAYTQYQADLALTLLEQYPNACLMTTGKDWTKLQALIPKNLSVAVIEPTPQIDWHMAFDQLQSILNKNPLFQRGKQEHPTTTPTLS